MNPSDKTRLFSILQELRSQQGMGWKEIAKIVEEEGYREGGKSLTDNALRKRYARWKETEGVTPTTSEPLPKQEQGEHDNEQPQKSRMESSIKQLEGGAALPALLPENAVVSSIASLVSLNDQLVEQVQETNVLIKRLEKRLEESKTSHTELTDEQLVTSRDLLEVIKEFAGRQEMKFIEENKEYDVSKEEIQQLIEETVGDRVDTELKSMLSAEGGFAKELTHLIDNRLKTLFSGGEHQPVVKTAHAGPGRGRKGKTHRKFSASLEEKLFERVKGLPGQFSGHLSNALEAYLSVVEEKETE